MIRPNRLALIFVASGLAMGCRSVIGGERASPLPFTPVGGAHRLSKPMAGTLKVVGPVARQELGPACRASGVKWPPARVALVAFKQEKVLEAWGANPSGAYAMLARYPILAASGTLGPKRREGDRQVPEGFYRIDSLNPASRFHLSMRVDYPNEQDRANSDIPRRERGGDIYVHGNAVSAGCIAIGDAAIERVFALVASARPAERRIIISPVDFRDRAVEAPSGPEWVRKMYGDLKKELAAFPRTVRSDSPARAVK